MMMTLLDLRTNKGLVRYYKYNGCFSIVSTMDFSGERAKIVCNENRRSVSDEKLLLHIPVQS